MNPVIAVSAVFAIALLLRGLSHKYRRSSDYDERQQLVRGNGYRCAFSAMILFEAFYAILLLFLDRPLMADGVSALCAVFIGITVFAVYCIRRDAFKTARNPARTRYYVILFTAVVVINGINSVLSLRDGDLVRDGLLQMPVTALFCTATFLSVLIALIQKARLDATEEAI